MPAAELAEWELFAEIEPFGSHYDDLRAGLAVSAIYNVNRDPNRATPPAGPLAFIAWNDLEQQRIEREQNPRMSPDQQSDALRTMLGFGR